MDPSQVVYQVKEKMNTLNLKAEKQGQLKYIEVVDKTCIRTGRKSYPLLPRDKSDNI